MKKCLQCEREFPEDEFWPNRRTEKSRRFALCRECRNQKARANHARRMRQRFQYTSVDNKDRPYVDLIHRLIASGELYNRLVLGNDDLKVIAREYKVQYKHLSHTLATLFPEFRFAFYRRVHIFSQVYRRLLDNPQLSRAKGTAGIISKSGFEFIEKAFGTHWTEMQAMALVSPQVDHVRQLVAVCDSLHHGCEPEEIAEKLSISIGDMIMLLVNYEDLVAENRSVIDMIDVIVGGDYEV